LIFSVRNIDFQKIFNDIAAAFPLEQKIYVLMKNYLYFMRLSGAILVALHLNAAGNCQTLLNENFSYPSGTSLTANGWNAHSGAETNPILVGTQGLVFPGYPSSDIGLCALLANNGQDVNKTFATVTTGPVYCAFLVQVQAIANGYFLHLGGTPIGNNHYGKVFINGTGNSFNFGLSKETADTVYTTGSPFTKGATYLIILKYSIVEGAKNDEVSLYIITGSIPATEPSVATIGPLADAGETDLANVSAVALRQYSAKQNIMVDGIRVATKWEVAVSALTGIEDPSRPDNPVLYPIPVSSELIISNARNVTMIEIFDFTGRKVISLNTEANEVVKIPVNHLKRGLYLIRLCTPGSIKIMKFIKS
jgi:hypothetical protein